MAEAVGRIAMRASAPPDSATKRSRISGLSNFSSPPPTARIEPCGRFVRGRVILGKTEYAMPRVRSTESLRRLSGRLTRDSFRLHSRADDVPFRSAALAVVDRAHLLCAHPGRRARPLPPGRAVSGGVRDLPLHVEGLHQPDQDADRPADLL